jgi:hypothetical protein
MTLLIDKLRRAQHANPEDKLHLGKPWVAHRAWAYRQIRNADARYDFSESALAMASDLKITTPKGLYRTLQSVLREPKVIWIEAQDRLRKKHLDGLRNTILRPLAEDESVPNRVGILLEVLEPGLARTRVVWDGPTETPGRQRAQEVLNGRHRNALEFEALAQQCALTVNPLLSVIDVRSEPHFLTEEEFVASVKDPQHPDHLQHLAQWNAASFKFDRDITDEERAKIAFWGYATSLTEDGQRTDNYDRDYLEYVSRGDKAAEAMLYAQAVDNVASELTNLVAMLAVLESESSPDILQVETRKARPTKKKAKRAKDIGLDPIRSVTLNVSSDIKKAYENAPQGVSEGSSTDHAGRVRHFVRGHYFWARNGLLTYRIPHWRGSVDPAERLTVTKVT